MNDDVYLCPQTAKLVIDTHVRSYEGEPNFAGVTEKDYEIIRLLALGKSSKQIAYNMELSPKTIDSRRRGILAKLKISNLAELTKFAIREGIVSLYSN